jgi:L-alanine-DL-glutamate epimerase-like enolase superfamily enzyme
MFVHRRQWLATTAAVGASLYSSPGRSQTEAAVQVTDEDLVRAAEAPVLKLDALTSPVIIDSVDLFRRGPDEFVRVRTRDGAEGVSLTNSRGSYLFPILQQLIVPYFVGKDARDLETHLWEVYRYRDNYKLQGLAFWSPLAWMEFAILDLLGRIANRPIGQLLGTIVRHEVPFYVASGRRDSTPEQEVEYLLRLLDETQAKAVKFRVGGRMSRNADAMPGRTERLIPLARRTLGDNIDLHADSNSSYDPPEAIRVGRMLEEVRAVYFEEPCRFDELEPTRRVADALTIPVAGGEQEYSQWRFQWMIRNRGVDIVQPDLHYYGGLIRSTRVARMAALAKLPTTVHISGGFGFVYMLHFASYTPDIGRYQEYKQGLERYGDWFDPPLEIRNGALTVPSGPGVGIRDVADLLKDARQLPPVSA